MGISSVCIQWILALCDALGNDNLLQVEECWAEITLNMKKKSVIEFNLPSQDRNTVEKIEIPFGAIALLSFTDEFWRYYALRFWQMWWFLKGSVWVLRIMWPEELLTSTPFNIDWLSILKYPRVGSERHQGLLHWLLQAFHEDFSKRAFIHDYNNKGWKRDGKEIWRKKWK